MPFVPGVDYVQLRFGPLGQIQCRANSKICVRGAVRRCQNLHR